MGDFFRRINTVHNRIPTAEEEQYPQWLPPRKYRTDGTLMDPTYGEFDHHFESVALAKCQTILVEFSPWASSTVHVVGFHR